MSCTCSTIGSFVLGLVALKVLQAIYVHFIYNNDLKRYGAGKGAWAVVTGASDGIGKAFAHRLAARGFNLLLISRTESKLNAVADEVRRTAKVEAAVVAADVSDASGAFWPAIDAALEGKAVRMLINNVAMNTEIPDTLEEMAEEDVEKQLQVNVRFTTKLTQRCLRIMRKQPKSAIVNVSSYTADAPAYLLSIYAASKAYLTKLSQMVDGEMKNVDCMSLKPHYVKTAMSGFRKTTTFVISPEACVAGALRKLGATDDVAPVPVHALRCYIEGLIPTSLIKGYALGVMKKVRSKLIRRKNKREAEAAGK
eukprot:PLAT10076.2.p1 GENE.PLAT10076.2~~PLAT10076.2.p1  ORF type:complete len:310 (+),score=177.54 PLAT10076.2:380-1309(+)